MANKSDRKRVTFSVELDQELAAKLVGTLGDTFANEGLLTDVDDDAKANIIERIANSMQSNEYRRDAMERIREMLPLDDGDSPKTAPEPADFDPEATAEFDPVPTRSLNV